MNNEQRRRIAQAYAGDADAFLSPELIAMIWELIQGFLSSCFPASIIIQRAIPRLRARMVHRIQDTVRAHKLQSQETFDEGQVSACIENLLETTTVQEMREAKRS